MSSYPKTKRELKPKLASYSPSHSSNLLMSPISSTKPRVSRMSPMTDRAIMANTSIHIICLLYMGIHYSPYICQTFNLAYQRWAVGGSVSPPTGCLSRSYHCLSSAHRLGHMSLWKLLTLVRSNPTQWSHPAHLCVGTGELSLLRS